MSASNFVKKSQMILNVGSLFLKLFLTYKLQLRLAREHHDKGIRHILQIQIRGNYMLFHGNALRAHPGLTFALLGGGGV